MTRAGVVIPCGAGREDNLRLCLQSLREQSVTPYHTVVVFDGEDAWTWEPAHEFPGVESWVVPKFRDGGEQPRNAGVRFLDPKCEVVWFVDSDIILAPDALRALLRKWSPGRIVIGAYDWLPEGVREPQQELLNDPRWEMFCEDRWKDPDYASLEELNVGLACFGGNLLWDRHEFERLGMFWNAVHRGEDGELGLRAVAHGVPIQCALTARGWHLHHPIDRKKIERENERNIPMIDERHPWIKGHGVLVVERDGKRFEQICPKCQLLVNTLEYFTHQAKCNG